MADKRLALTLAFNGTGNLSSVMRRMTGEGGAARQSLKALNDTYRDQKRELGDVQRQLKSASGNVTELMNRERDLGNQIARTNTQLDRQKAAIARQDRADAIGRAATSSGTKNLATGAAMSGGLIVVGKMSSDFQDGMTDIQQKANLTAQATEAMKSDILAAARASKQLPENLRAGVDTLAGFGMSPAEATRMISPIGKAATAYRAEVDDLAASTYANFSNLKVPVEETARAIDIMAAAGKSGAFEINDMARHFPALTAQMQAYNQEGVGAVADLSAALQIARKATGDSASAATNVQNLLAKINTEETIKKFAKLGVNLPKALEKAYAEGKTPLEAIAEITNKTLGGDLSRLSFLFGDMQAQSALRPLIQNMDEYRKIRTEALNAKGVVDEDFALRAQNASVQARALTGNLIIMATQLGDRLLPSFVKVSATAVSLIERFSQWAEKNPLVIDLIMKTVVAIALLNLGLGAARLAFGATVGPAMKLANGLIWLSVASNRAAMAGKFAAIGTAVMGLGRTMAAAGAMMLANPIILVITAIVAALAFALPWIINNWGAIKAFFGAFFGSLATSFQPAIDTIQGALQWLGGLWDQIKGPMASSFEFVKGLFMMFTPLGWIIRAVQPMLDWLGTLNLRQLGENMLQGLIDGILSKLGPLEGVFRKAANAGVDAFKAEAKIKSPSRVMMQMGSFMSDGLAMGMESGMRDPLNVARSMAAGVAGAMTLSSSALAAEPLPPIKSLSQVAQESHKAAAGIGGPAGASGLSIQIGSITIPITAAAGQSAKEIAQAVADAFRDQMEALEARTRSAFADGME